MQNSAANAISGDAESQVLRIKTELVRRFAGVGGSMASGGSFAALFPAVASEHVEEALHRLWQEGVVESYCLSDGALAYHFPAR